MKTIHRALLLLGLVCLSMGSLNPVMAQEERSVDQYYDMLESDDETVRENGVRLILAREPKNSKALENLLELEEERGNYKEAIAWVKRLEKAGVLVSGQASERISRLEEKLANQDHISIWENRFDRFKLKEQYSLALIEVRKLKAWFATKKARAEEQMPDLASDSFEYREAAGQRKNARFQISEYEEWEKEILERMKD